MIPDKIYVGVGTLSSIQPAEEYAFPGWQEKPYSQIRNEEYIRKDVLMEWLLKGVEASEICESEYGDACAQAYQSVIDKLNSM